MTLPSPAAPAEPVLRLSDLAVGYGEHRVCGRVTADLAAGRALALVGPNGSGKSTVLSTVAGRLPPLDGEARIHGRLVDDREAWFRRAVAVVFDDDAFFPALTVREHLMLVATGHSVEDARTAIERELAFFGLDDEGESFPLALSSGQRRRFLLAAGFVRPRSLMILDEPEQRLDTRMRRALARRLRTETTAGASLLLATHDARFLETVADDVLVVGEPIRPVTPREGATIVEG